MGKLEQELINKIDSLYGIQISSKSQILRFVKEKNNFERPIGQAVQYFLDNPEELYQCILERTDLPILPVCNKRKN